MALKSKLRSLRQFIPLATALLLAALVAVPSSGIAQAQSPPGNEIVLVNADRDFVERKKGGEFVARPLFDREIADLFYAVRDADTGDWISAMYRVKGGEFVARPLFDREIADLFYAVRDADTGDWISAMYRVKGGEKKRGDGWEYSWEYPDLDEHTDLDRDRAYLLVMLATAEDGLRGDFYAVVPIYQPGRIWDKILSALSPARWAKAFAGWVIEGVHGTLCGVVERASGEDGLRGDFYAVVPIYQPGRIWDKILSALSPARWAKAFAGWVIEGVHGTLCGVVERASGEDAANCGGG